MADDLLKALDYKNENAIEVIKYLISRHDVFWALYVAGIYGPEWVDGYDEKALAGEVAALVDKTSGFITSEAVYRMLFVVALADVYASGNRYISDNFIDYVVAAIGKLAQLSDIQIRGPNTEERGTGYNASSPISGKNAPKTLGDIIRP